MKIDYLASYDELKRARSVTKTTPAAVQAALGKFAAVLTQQVDNTDKNQVVSNLESEPKSAPLDTQRVLIEANKKLAESVKILSNDEVDEPIEPTQTASVAKETTLTKSVMPEKVAAQIKESVNTILDKSVTNLENSDQTINSIIDDAGSRHGIDPLLARSVAQAESSFDPHAVSSDGYNSKGLFQLLDSTGESTRARLNIADPYKPFDPNQNTELGIGHLRYLHDLFSTQSDLGNNMTTEPAANSASLEKLAVAAYNAGEGRVASAQARAKAAKKDPADYAAIEQFLPESTRSYVEKVFTTRTKLAAADMPRILGS